ncbi:MAG: methyltransferase domain-containing protein, partial [Campylobacterales bacterium]
YHKPMAEGWDEAATAFCERFNVSLIGRSKGVKKVVGRDYVTETVEIEGRLWTYKQIEGSFTQPNGYANRAMIGWALKHTPKTGGDFLELYCGNGNFTLPLSTRFGRAVAIEISKSSLAAARENAEKNGVDNIFFARMGAEEFAQAIAKVRPFNRLSDLDLDSLNFQAALVDPPRAGLDPDSLALASQMPKMIYVSCNPETLARDLRLLENTHRVKALALFDQFPYTPHLESAVVLERK